MMGEQRITIVTGPRDSGKTSWITNEYHLLGGDGIIMPKVFEDDTHLGYDIQFLSSGDRLAVCRSKKILDGLESVGGSPERGICRWEFDEEMFTKAEASIRNITGWDSKSPFFIDEIGALELEGRGFSNLLSSLLSRAGSLEVGDLYIGMRLNLVRDLIKRFGIRYTDILFLRLKGSRL